MIKLCVFLKAKQIPQADRENHYLCNHKTISDERRTEKNRKGICS